MRKSQKQVPSPPDRINSPSLPALRLPAPQGAGWEGAKPAFWASGLASLAGLQVCRQPGQREESLPPSCDPSTLALAAPPQPGSRPHCEMFIHCPAVDSPPGERLAAPPRVGDNPGTGEADPLHSSAQLDGTSPFPDVQRITSHSRRMADPPPSPSLQIRRWHGKAFPELVVCACHFPKNSTPVGQARRF